MLPRARQVNFNAMSNELAPEIQNAARLARLRRTALLDTPAEAAFDRLTRLAARVLAAPVAMVSLVDDGRDFVKSCVGLPEPYASTRVIPMTPTFCQHAVATRASLLVDDALGDPRFAHFPAVRDLGVRAYAGVPLVTADGHAIGSFCVIDFLPRAWTDEDLATLTDLAAATMTEIELRESAAELEARTADAERDQMRISGVLESISDAFFALDHEWRFTYVNARAEALLARTRGELLGRSAWTEFPDAVGAMFDREYHRAVEEGVTVQFEASYPSPDTWFRVHAYPFDEGLSVFFQDIGESKRITDAMRASEARYRSLVEATTSMVWRGDASGAIIDVVPGWEAITGQSAGEYARFGWLAVLHPDDRAPMADAWLEGVRTKKPLKMEYRLRTRDESYRIMAVRGVPILDDAGEVREWVGTLTDITEHRVATREREAALARERIARAEADAANLAKSGFLANMSHEIRTPINAIIGYTELLELQLPGPITEEQQRFLGRVRASSRHLLGLVNEVLDLAKVESGSIVIDRDVHPAGDAVSAAIALVTPQALARGVLVSDRCESHQDARYLGDEARVRQILTNLLNNAVQACRRGDRVLVTCGREMGDDGERVAIRVSDTGSGISPEKLNAIFEPFVQAESGHTRTQGGTGLGLTISRRLAKLMGGRLSVQSVVDEGSVFTLSLPAAPAPHANATAGLDERPLAAARGVPSRRRTGVAEAVDGAAPAGQGLHAASAADSPDAGLGSVAEHVAAQAAAIVAAISARLRTDPSTPRARELPPVQLVDHLPTLIADMTQSLMTLEAGGPDPVLLRDGTDIQRVIAERHGQQRARYGWTEHELRAEHAIVREELERVARRTPGVASAVIDRAMRVLRGLLMSADRSSLQSLRLSTSE